MISLKDKVVIITGGGRGIGYGLSTAFAKAGAKLVITGRTESTLLSAKEKLQAETGAEVSAVMSGIVESIYRDDILSGTEIVVDHGDGLKSVYRFVTVAENLKVGDEVAQGDVIATVAAATGDEYKDGAHLHFEVVKNGIAVDPTTYLTLEEK